MKRAPVFVLILSVLIAGCSPGHGEGGQLSKEQVVELYPNAGYLELDDGTVYLAGVDWVNEKDYSKGRKIGEVKEGMANQLPVGSEVFQTKASVPVLIVEYKGLEKRYLLAAGE